MQRNHADDPIITSQKTVNSNNRIQCINMLVHFNYENQFRCKVVYWKSTESSQNIFCAASPLSSCNFNTSQATTVTSFGSICLLLSQKSSFYDEVSAECSQQNATLFNTSASDAKLAYVTLWMNQLNLQGFVWIMTSRDTSDSDECSELYRDTGSNQWLTRDVACSFKNYFLCEKSKQLFRALQRISSLNDINF